MMRTYLTHARLVISSLANLSGALVKIQPEVGLRQGGRDGM